MDDKNLIILVKKPSPQQMLCEENVNKPDILNEDELMHFGIKGMKWGVRRFQNSDGTLTEVGKARLALLRSKDPKKAKKFEVAVLKSTVRMKKSEEKQKRKDEYKNSDAYKEKQNKKEVKKQLRAKKRKQKLDNFLNDVPRKNKLKQRYIAEGPKAVAKHIDLFTERELQTITNRFKTQEALRQIRSEKGRRIQGDINRIIGYGNSMNNAIKFLNSDAGKEIRKQLGDVNYMNNIMEYNKKEKNKEKNKGNGSDKEIKDLLKKISSQLESNNRSDLEKSSTKKPKKSEKRH